MSCLEVLRPHIMYQKNRRLGFVQWSGNFVAISNDDSDCTSFDI